MKEVRCIDCRNYTIKNDKNFCLSWGKYTTISITKYSTCRDFKQKPYKRIIKGILDEI